ncbi:hypothetical protein L2E82_12085 [Cichorium intybus]|uniref:Uncharacterized protein n=1 Tax=Cichorium intybus TaxID=13427 RepID=A0ACB9GFT9_CICIN|nr:hypothetical protein L2E82_12085 [Cichorium intybus]
MDSDRKRVSMNSSKNGVVMGSVWESRMKGSLKVFNGDDKNQDIEKPTEKNQSIESTREIVKMEKVALRSKQSSNGVGGGGKRKTWKSDCNFEGTEKIPVQIPKARSENKKVLSELSKEVSVSMDGIGIKKSPVQMKKGRQEWSKEQSVSIDGSERSPVQRTITTRSLSRKGSTSSDLSNGVEKVNSSSTKGNRISDESNNGVEEIKGGNRDDNEIKKNRSDSSQSLDELDVCEEKMMTDDLGKVKSPRSLDTECYEEHEEASNTVTMAEKEEINEERAIVVVKEMEPVSTINKKKSQDVVIEDKKIHHRNERSNPISRTIRKQPSPVVNHPRIISKPNEFPSQRVPKSNNRLQTLIDLIMWSDASKSALIFGLGTFSILSSSYTKDLNISFISVISYLGLIYLAAIFIFRSFIKRGVVETDNVTDEEQCVVGEEEAIWALKLFLPYVNEFLLKVKALFSGDPSTTMKLAVLLFVLARCGSSITIWKMAKLGFFGGFTLPKICSSYSSQLTAYGTFWVRRFKDAWETCTQKKAVAFGVFTLVWNISSIVARIWAVFMLLVAFKYYQQSMMKDEVVEEEEPMTRGYQSSWQEQRHGKISVPTESTKLRKRS